MSRVNLGGGELHTHMTSRAGVPARIYLGLLNGADGSNLWARTYGDDDGKARCGGLAVAPDGRIVLVGGFGRSVDEPEFVRMMGMPEPPSTPFRWDLGDRSLTLVAPGARAMFVLNVLP